MASCIRVLHLRSSAESGGGPEKTIFKTCRLIDATRFSYSVIYIAKHGQDLSPIAERARESACEYLELKGLPLVDPRHLFFLRRFIMRHGVHIVHCHEPKSDVYGVLLRMLCPGVKIATTLHGWVSRGTGKSSFYVALDKFLLRFFHLVIAVHGDTMDALRRRGLERVALLHNAVDVEEWRPAGERTRGDNFHVAWIGRLSAEKGGLDCIRVAAQVLREAPGVVFHIVGDGPEREPMELLARELGVDGRVRFEGFLPEHEVRRRFEGWDAVLSTSHTEGTPNTLLEAMAMATPIVATAVGGVPDLLEQGEVGLLSPAGDIRALAAAVLELRDDPGKGARLADAARERVVRRYSFRERVRRLEGLYEALAER